MFGQPTHSGLPLLPAAIARNIRRATPETLHPEEPLLHSNPASSETQKHNEANGEHGADGTHASISGNLDHKIGEGESSSSEHSASDYDPRDIDPQYDDGSEDGQFISCRPELL